MQNSCFRNTYKSGAPDSGGQYKRKEKGNGSKCPHYQNAPPPPKKNHDKRIIGYCFYSKSIHS